MFAPVTGFFKRMRKKDALLSMDNEPINPLERVLYIRNTLASDLEFYLNSRCKVQDGNSAYTLFNSCLFDRAVYARKEPVCLQDFLPRSHSNIVGVRHEETHFGDNYVGEETEVSYTDVVYQEDEGPAGYFFVGRDPATGTKKKILKDTKCISLNPQGKYLDSFYNQHLTLERIIVADRLRYNLLELVLHADHPNAPNAPNCTKIFYDSFKALLDNAKIENRKLSAKYNKKHGSYFQLVADLRAEKGKVTFKDKCAAFFGRSPFKSALDKTLEKASRSLDAWYKEQELVSKQPVTPQLK